MSERRRPQLDAQELAESGPAEAVSIPIDLVDPSPRNPRAKLSQVEELAANIERYGLMQPVIVRRVDDRYQLIGGHRRRAAFLVLRDRNPLVPRWRAIAAVVVSADDERAADMLISAQVHSINWKPREQAAALERLAVAGLTLKEIGERFSRTEAWASKRLRIYADVALSALVQTGRLSAGVAEEFLTIRDFETKKAYAELAAAEGWSQDDARGRVRALRLDLATRQLGRVTRELVDILSRLDGSRLSIEVFRDLQVLKGRIDVLGEQARGTTPRMPTIAEAEASAGVTEQAKKRAETKRRQTKLRRRAKPKA